MLNKFFIVISGPTGVGKTDFADMLAKSFEQKLNLKTEIINSDLGQFYSPLDIGTAKPDLKNCSNYSLFNILDKPENFTVHDFRKLLISKFEELWDKQIIPIVVGGSMFYVKSIFFPPKEIEFQNLNSNTNPDIKCQDMASHSVVDLYERLCSIDPERSRKINKNDRYRIERALNLWYSSGKKPSEFMPEFSMPYGSNAVFYYLNRDRQELYDIINNRTKKMFDAGLLEEVKNLDQTWKEFLIRKKIIGYDDVIDYLDNNLNNLDILIEQINQRTRNYAKRQLTFYRQLINLLEEENKNNISIKDINQINLSELNIDLYIDKLLLNLKEYIIK